MLRIEQVVANLFGCGGRLGCIWDWHRDGKRQNLFFSGRSTSGRGSPETEIPETPHRCSRLAAAADPDEAATPADRRAGPPNRPAGVVAQPEEMWGGVSPDGTPISRATVPEAPIR
jgi:hypothetical protein